MRERYSESMKEHERKIESARKRKRKHLKRKAILARAGPLKFPLGLKLPRGD